MLYAKKITEKQLGHILKQALGKESFKAPEPHSHSQVNTSGNVSQTYRIISHICLEKKALF